MKEEKELVFKISKIAYEHKAEDIVVLDISNLTIIADYFIICSGNTTRHVQAISYEIEQKLKKNEGLLPLGIEGYTEGKWILMDYGDIIVHIFLDEVRKYYELEDLWADAPQCNFNFQNESEEIINKS